jgi:hypothetical protein
MISKEELMRRLPTDFGGLPAGRIERVEHELEPWEKRCHALADVLDFHKIINTEEKRRGVEALGSELIGRLSYYERWIVAFANILFRKIDPHPGPACPQDGRGRRTLSAKSGRREIARCG